MTTLLAGRVIAAAILLASIIVPALVAEWADKRKQRRNG